ncbi:unnamed protein product [Diatraea saccharalis]|uniref:Uncharacterized protein n=1 Tax=Diatraea saccharalis TaxID=40085 RepID=A0A9N9RFD9_9NEOP|nr:unnamed protein product [Diatraea saccharalis]
MRNGSRKIFTVICSEKLWGGNTLQFPIAWVAGTGGRAASLRLANGRVAAQSAEQLPHSPADCASVRISIDNTNTCCTDSLVTALDDETLLLGKSLEFIAETSAHVV